MKKSFLSKIFALVLCLTMIIATGAAPEKSLAASEKLTGAYEDAKSPTLTKSRTKLFNKAFKNFTGSKVTPVAYLAKQVVAGTNHLYLARIKAVVPGAEETYAFVSIYKDLQGKVSINEIINTGTETKINELPGGWFQSSSPKLTKSIKKAVNKALKDLDGVAYTPVALVAEQVVAGMNYCVLCRSTVIYPGAQTGYSLVYFYKGRDGKVKLDNIVNLSDTPDSDYYISSEDAGTAGFDLEAAKEFSAKVYKANDLRSILSKHRSVSYFEKDYVGDGYVTYLNYETKNDYYHERYGYSEYYKDRLGYTVYWDNGAGPMASYRIDLSSNPDSIFYQFVPETEDQWIDYDHETITSFTIKDGIAYLTSEYDKYNSEHLFTDFLGLEYDGETLVKCELVADAESYEVISNKNILVKDGVEIEGVTCTVSYDVDEPYACTNMKSYFERTSEKTMTVTFVADPGSTAERSKTITIPVNSEVSFTCDNMDTMQLFDDPECTIPSTVHWDRMSDKTGYILTKPRE